MKKIISLLTACVCLLSINVNAANLSEMTEMIMGYYKFEIMEDLSGIEKLQNRRNIQNPALISTAINNGVLIVKNGLINEKGTDYTPLTNGIVKRYINDSNYTFISGGYVDLIRNKNVLFNEDTFFITENLRESDLNYRDKYTCVTDRDNNVIFLWKSTDFIQPSVYRAKLYWAEEGELVVTDMYKRGFDLWIKVNSGNFCSLDSSDIGISQDFIMNNLDKYIYIFADDYGEKIIVKGISD